VRRRGCEGVVAADFDGDGDGTFQTWQTIRLGSLPAPIRAVDLNRDGHADLVTLDFGDDTLTVLLWIDGYRCL
jgi:hypothetical protein